MLVSWVSPDCPPEVAKRFLNRVVAFEQTQETVLFEHLIASGIALPAPDALQEAELGFKLAQVIGALAALGTYLQYTDHLNDRELYAYLWEHALREPTRIFPGDFDFAYFIDMIGSGSEEDIELYLKYHADDEARDSFARDLPGLVIPERQPPPFKRDAMLPKPRNR